MARLEEWSSSAEAGREASEGGTEFGLRLAAILLNVAYLVTGGAGSSVRTSPKNWSDAASRCASSTASSPGTVAIWTASAVEFIEGDLAEPGVAARAVSGMDYVLHQAAIPSVPRSVNDPLASNQANLTASLNVLVAARAAGVKRLVFAGSSSVYGDTPTLPKREDMPTNPLSPYALQKLVANSTVRCSRACTASKR